MSHLRSIPRTEAAAQTGIDYHIHEAGTELRQLQQQVCLKDLRDRNQKNHGGAKCDYSEWIMQ